jgi:hypothetical protein
MPPKLEIDGLQFAEGHRWHADALWCSDMFGHCVVRCQPGHEPEEFVGCRLTTLRALDGL